MIPLRKRVERITRGCVHEKSRTREVIIRLDPPFTMSARLKGTKTWYTMSADIFYQLAVEHEMKKQKRIARANGQAHHG